MEGTTEKDCSPLWNLYQQIVSDMKNSAPMWEEFISKATKLHSALKSALVAIAAFLDAFQKIADAATNARVPESGDVSPSKKGPGVSDENASLNPALQSQELNDMEKVKTPEKSSIKTTKIIAKGAKRKILETNEGATKEIGTALTRVCLRHRAIESRMKTFIGVLMDTLITPLSERADEWRRGGCATGALSREHARECKRARTELRRRVADAQRQARKARRQPSDVRRRADVSMQDVQERKQQLEEMEEKAVKAALIEERSRFCHFVSLLNPVVESEVAMLAEVGHLAEGGEQLQRHTAEPRTLPAASLQVICDIKSCYSGWAESSPPPSRLGSRKSSLTSLSSLTSHCSEQHGGGSVSCSTPVSSASSGGTLHSHTHYSQSSRLVSVCSADSGFRSQDALQRPSLYVDNGSDNQSVSSECLTPSKSVADEPTDDTDIDIMGNAASATWPDLKDTAQFERAASAIMGGRHTISAGCSSPRAALSAHTFEEQHTHSRPPLPTRCSSLERPSVPAKASNPGQSEFKLNKPTSLPPHLTKEMPQAVYVNMSELATLAATRAQQHAAEQPQQEKVCSESSASESSLESSSGYGSQGAFAAEDHALQHQLQHPDVEIVTLRRVSECSVSSARESFSLSLGSLREAVRELDADSQTFATVSGKPAVPARRPLSMTASVWSRRGSVSSVGKPPPPVRRSSSISRQRPAYSQGGQCTSEADNLPPPPAFLLQPDNNDTTAHQTHQTTNVAETIKQLTELKHTPASPGLIRRSVQHSPLSTFNRSWGSTVSVNSANSANSANSSAGNVNPIYGQTGHRMLAFDNLYGRTTAQESREAAGGTYSDCGGVGSSPSTPSFTENNSFTSFGPRNTNESHYGQTGFKLQQEKRYTGAYEQLSPRARRLRPHSADRHAEQQSSLIASLSAKLAPQLSPRTNRRPAASAAESPKPNTNKAVGGAVQAAFLDKLSATLARHNRHTHTPLTQADLRVCHNSLMEQIKRGATLRRNKQCNDRSAPKIR